MAGDTNGAAWWKYTATAAVSCLITVGSFWFGGGNQFISRDEAHKIVGENSPYLRDKTAIEQRFQTTDRDISRLTEKVDKVIDGQQKISTDVQAVLKRLENK